jgi:hypothetical protein
MLHSLQINLQQEVAGIFFLETYFTLLFLVATFHKSLYTSISKLEIKEA